MTGDLDLSPPRVSGLCAETLRPFVPPETGGWAGQDQSFGLTSLKDPTADGALGTDWELLRKFNLFWPRQDASPPDFPWLGSLVGRKKAWRWVSQFPRLFRDVEPNHTPFILDFISRTLTEVEPAVGSEEGDKTCCRKRPEPPVLLPDPDDFPEDDCRIHNCYPHCLDGMEVGSEPIGLGCCQEVCATTGPGPCGPCMFS